MVANALGSFAVLKRNVLAEHVYTFLIISGAICIIRRNQPIRACQGQAPGLLHLQEPCFREK